VCQEAASRQWWERTLKWSFFVSCCLCFAVACVAGFKKKGHHDGNGADYQSKCNREEL